MDKSVVCPTILIFEIILPFQSVKNYHVIDGHGPEQKLIKIKDSFAIIHELVKGFFAIAFQESKTIIALTS